MGEYLYFSLLGTDKSTGEFVPLIAGELPQVSEDLTVYTYTIHEQARFNSGKRIKASDVLFSLKLRLNPFTDNEHDRSQYTDIASAEAIDEATLRISLKQPSPQGLRITSDFPIMARDLIDPENVLGSISVAAFQQKEGLAPEYSDAARNVARRINAFAHSFTTYNPEAVSGPYLLSNWERGKKIVMEANKKFWGRKLASPPNAFFQQNANQIVFLTTADSETRSGLFNKRVDLVTSIHASLFFELSEIPSLADHYDFQSVPGPAYEYIGMNMQGSARQRPPLLESSSVRKAIAHLVNVDLLQARVNYGMGERLAADYPTHKPEYRNQDLGMISFDMEKARQLLADDGWADTDGNGLLDKEINGEQVQFVAELIYNDNAPQRKRIAEHLQENAKQLGILVTIQALELDAYLKRLELGEFDLYVGAWVSDPNEDTYRQIWHSENWGGGANFVGFGTDETDALIEHYDQLMDPGARLALSKAIQTKIYDAQPYVFLWVRTHNIVVRKNLKTHLYQSRPGFWIAEWE